VQVVGAEDVVRSLRAMGRAGRKVTKRVFGEVASETVTAAGPLTPVEPEDGGYLRKSLRKSGPTETKTAGVFVAVVAGGAPLEAHLRATGHKKNVYAVVQHEDSTLRHKTGQAKFLATPFFRKVAEVPDRLIDGLDQERDRVVGGS
jgi:hypothetical protein